MRRGLFCLVLLLAGCAGIPPDSYDAKDRFVDVSSVVSGLKVDLRYYGSDNFLGRRVAGYDQPVCLLTHEAAAALARVQNRLSPFGMGLKVFDCYRPQRAVADFLAWARDLSDQKRKAVHYPNVDKSRLFELGYLAEKSGHSRGSTVDLTLVDLRTGAEIDMGAGYDLFDTRSWPSSQDITPDARAGRLALQALMIAEGFRPLKEEWWHFTLENEPFPNTYFDFPVAGTAAQHGA